MNQHVVVIGGGLMGLGVAVALAERGLGVVICEKQEPARESSWAAAGMLAPHPEVEFHDDALLMLALESARLWPARAEALERATGVAVGYDATGTLLVARDRDDREALERTARYLVSRGAEAPWLDADAVRALEPALNPSVVGGLRFAGDHQVDNRGVLAALLARARALGVVLRVDAAVTAVEAHAGRVSGVRLASGEVVTTDRAVVAAGAWSRSLDVGLRARAPVRPVRGQMLAARPPLGAPTVRHVVRGLQSYLVPKPDGRLVVGATSEERGFERVMTAGGLFYLLEHARELLPGVDEFHVEETWIGFRPGSRDNRPLLGQGSVEGLFWCTGHYRNGVQLWPISVDLVCRAVLNEALPELAAPFSPVRAGL